MVYSARMQDISFTKKVFENGLRYVYIPQSQSLATTVLVLVSAGSEYESKELNGISHFLEHLCFKGTKNRPSSGMISEELDSIGAEYNAFTGKEMTGYFAKVANDKFEKALEIVSDLYLNPIIDAAEMEKERGVIIEEINMYEDHPKWKVAEDFEELLYGDQPAGWSIAGNKEKVGKISQNDILDYRKAHYIAGKTVVIVAGGIGYDPEKLVKEHFLNIPSGDVIKKVPTIEKQNEPAILLRRKETDQSHVVIGVRAFDMEDDRKYALMVLADILGGGMSSRLFRKVRDELGAAYYIKSSADLGTDCGVLDISAGIDKTRVKEIVSAIMEELRRFANEPVPAVEITRSKDHLSGRIVLGLETSDELAGFFGGDEILVGKVHTPVELLNNLNKVTAEEIISVAKDIMKDVGLNLAAIGQFPEGMEGELKEVLKF